jgi:ATP-dependent DNA helicase RecQ
MSGSNSPSEILQQYWGHNSFRPLQEDIINSILEGKDTLALLPTGGGKSICFQVPALAKDGICLVISPLIALIKDQVENLKNKGIPALAIYAGLSFIEVKKILQNAAYGNYKFLYVSPERLKTKLFLEYLPALSVNLIAVDEAHCISQWGYDFRPPYLQISSIREQLPKVPIIALTASATAAVQNDICEKLLFPPSHQRFQQSFERPNLSYSVFNVTDKTNKLVAVLNNVKGSAIVYCKSRKGTKDVADLLKMHKINADYYHAGLSSDERNAKQESWIKNKIRVIVCTNAFGMGIDKPDVRAVIHYHVPDCIENYYQEAGRAGRDGKRSYAVLLYNSNELKDLLLQIDIRFPAVEEIKHIYIALMNHLQVAAGIGEGISYDFDIALFANAFKLNILTATYAIKALAQEGVLTYNESFFNPSSAVFISGKEDLLELEKQQPQLDDLVKGLLRCYEGIFDFPSTIYETQLAKFIKKPIAVIKQQLSTLHQLRIIEYNPQKEKPQIFLLQNRMYRDNYKINSEAYLTRRKIYEQKIYSISAYVQEQKICRGKWIANYFNDVKIKDCGICDNCINQKEKPISAAEFELLQTELFAMLKNQNRPIKELLCNYSSNKQRRLNKVINYLITENIIRISEEGVLLKQAVPEIKKGPR